MAPADRTVDQEEDAMPSLDPEELAQLLPAETASFAAPIQPRA